VRRSWPVRAPGVGASAEIPGNRFRYRAAKDQVAIPGKNSQQISNFTQLMRRLQKFGPIINRASLCISPPCSRID
jgi:hypothetical protein